MDFYSKRKTQAIPRCRYLVLTKGQLSCSRETEINDILLYNLMARNNLDHEVILFMKVDESSIYKLLAPGPEERKCVWKLVPEETASKTLLLIDDTGCLAVLTS